MTDKYNRLEYSFAVADKMKELAHEKRPDDMNYAEDMYLLGLLHGIGHLVDADRPSISGGLFMMRQGYKYWEAIYSLGNPNSKYSSDELDLLNQSIDAVGEANDDCL